MIVAEKLKVFDIDGTLLLWGTSSSHQGKKCTFLNPNHGVYETAVIYEKHVNEIVRLKKAGYTIIVWSHSGGLYSKNVVKALGIEKYVDLVSSKPMDYYDDEKVENWMGPRIWLEEDEFVDHD